VSERTYRSITLTGTTSEAIQVGPDQSFVGLVLPDIASTAITFTGSVDGNTYVTVKDVGGGAYSLTAADSVYVPVDPRVFVGLPYVKVVFGSSETAITFQVCMCAVG